MGRVGVYAGTFDPVHEGHILFALVAAKVAGLERVVFVPEPNPRFKTNVSGLKDRLAMLELAMSNYPNLGVAQLADVQFTVSKTLPQLRRLYGEIALLLGSDVAKTICHWPDKAQLFATTELVIGLRGKDSAKDMQSLFKGEGVIFRCLPSPANSASSSQARQSGGIKHVDTGVADYIVRRRLYTLAPTAK